MENYVLRTSLILYLFSEDEAAKYSRCDHVVIYKRNSGGYIAAVLTWKYKQEISQRWQDSTRSLKWKPTHSFNATLCSGARSLPNKQNPKQNSLKLSSVNFTSGDPNSWLIKLYLYYLYLPFIQMRMQIIYPQINICFLQSWFSVFRSSGEHF